MSDNNHDKNSDDYFEKWVEDVLAQATESPPMAGAMGQMGITVSDAVYGVTMGKVFWEERNQDRGEKIPEDFTKIFLDGAMWVCTLLVKRGEELMVHLAETLEGDDLKELNEFLGVFGAPGKDGSDE